ncbi:tripartite tricarboxylate transporter permease [Boseongicola sp. H5]|uniref:tripartite tricarboxylate transporter permease n=1 Tax=Boseongicola sp. H5 TaxID=2763261 RepID=UPI001AFF57E8|nr:tripartite tricarboxylate transporter permease [Boseongicola sp. H5]MBO6921953.1 tripartite tricarboxylate transporter permease [Roseicyclus sp.]
MENIALALEEFARPAVLLALVVGSVWGTVAGALPGIGTVAALIVALPFTFGMSTEASIGLFMGIYVSSVYGGSISAILINTPGTPQSAATVLDGYPMAKAGKADLAIGWATLASLVGGVFSLIVLIVAAPILARVSIAFGPAAIFAIIVFALTCIAWVSTGSTIKGLLAGMIGLFLTTIGPDDLTGYTRFDFGQPALMGGLSLIPVLIGIFALSEVFHRAAFYFAAKAPDVTNVGFRMPPRREVLVRVPQFLRASIIGTFVGILPGTGATAATFVSYSELRRTSPRSDNFGKGEPDGLIASEASNNAVTGGALIPTLALGIPGDGGTVVLLGVLTIQGLTPGFDLAQNNPHILTGAFLLILIANLIMFGLGVLGARIFARILSMPEPVLMAFILVFSIVGAFVVRGNHVDILICAIAGVAGVILRFAKYPVAPIVIGMALGATFEGKLRQGLISADGNVVEFLSDPIALSILGATFLFVLVSLVRLLSKGADSA